MHKDILILSLLKGLLAGFILASSDAVKCIDCSTCVCVGKTATCSGVSSKDPLCLPYNITELSIVDSPDMTQVSETYLYNYEHLTKFALIRTGLNYINEDGFQKLQNLQDARIEDTNNFSISSDNLFVKLTKLKTVAITGSSNVQTIESAFANIESLQTLNLSRNHITSLHETALKGSNDVQIIDLSYNPSLAFLPRDIFLHLKRLKKLLINNCNMMLLYSEHVKTPFSNGNLEYFLGIRNEWRCEYMCEFIMWANESGFGRVADMGYCGEYSDFPNQIVLNISTDKICGLSSTDPPLLDTSYKGIRMLAYILVAMLALKFIYWCIKKMFCSSDGSVTFEQQTQNDYNRSFSATRAALNRNANRRRNIDRHTARWNIEEPIDTDDNEISTVYAENDLPKYEDVVAGDLLYTINNSDTSSAPQEPSPDIDIFESATDTALDSPVQLAPPPPYETKD